MIRSSAAAVVSVVNEHQGVGARADVKIDPRTLPLTDDRRYAVVVEAASGTVTAVVLEYAEGGDNAMAYEAFAGN